VKSPQVYLVCDILLKSAGLVTAIAVAIATLGIPLPDLVMKDLAEAFPCMNCGCGCVNADMCWRQCCCYTSSQKLAWANERGVKLPPYLLERVAAEIDAEPTELADEKPCCRQRNRAANAASRCDRGVSSSPPAPDVEPPLIPGVLAIHALKCQGNSLTLSLLPPSVPTDAISCQLPVAAGESILLTENLLYQPPFFDAVVPPPEFAIL
jgi:hypothetical protein